MTAVRTATMRRNEAMTLSTQNTYARNNDTRCAYTTQMKTCRLEIFTAANYHHYYKKETNSIHDE